MLTLTILGTMNMFWICEATSHPQIAMKKSLNHKITFMKPTVLMRFSYYPNFRLTFAVTCASPTRLSTIAIMRMKALDRYKEKTVWCGWTFSVLNQNVRAKCM